MMIEVALKRAVYLVASNFGSLLGLVVALSLLGQQHRLDVGQDTALSDGDFAQQLVELLVVADGQLQVARDDARLLVVPGRVARQLQDLGRQVLQHRRQVHRGPGTDTLGVVTLAEQTVHSAHGELETGPRRASLGLSASFAALFATSRHDSGSTVTVENDFSERRNGNFITPAGREKKAVRLATVLLLFRPMEMRLCRMLTLIGRS